MQRLIQDWCTVYRLDESHLTGEAEDVLKDERAAPMLLSGSKVLEGYGRMVVTAVGTSSQQGIINKLVSGEGDKGGQEDAEDGLRYSRPMPNLALIYLN